MAEINIDKAIEAIEQQQVPQMVEFTVQDDFVKKLPQILSNVQVVKQWAVAQTEQDRKLVLQSDDDFENAKKRCAAINKVIASIEARRKDVKKQYVAPYEIFEKSLKEVTGVLTEAKDNLWSQVTEAEEAAKAAKETKYRSYFEQQADENQISTYRAWSQIFDKTWLNKSKTADVVFSEIDAKIKAVVEELNAIAALNSEFETELLRQYKNGGTITQILTLNSELKKQKEENERRKAELAARIKAEQQERESRAESRAATENAAERQSAAQNEQDKPTEQLITVDFRVRCTPQQLRELGAYMKANNIHYGKVPQE